MFLGIEIGGTKLQLGVGRGDGSPLVALERRDVDIPAGAAGIREQIREAALPLVARHGARGVAFGFGGPVDMAAGLAIKSHQVAGWDNFPLARWCGETLSLPTIVGNDCDVAALAEASFGAGRGLNPVFYVTVGTGIGGGLSIDRTIFRGGGGGAAEIGHLRPGLDCLDAHATVESIAAGPGIAATARGLVASHPGADAERLLQRAGGEPRHITAQQVAEEAATGNRLARQAFDRATRTLGWAVAQVITLVAPAAVVIGGGVSLAGEELFYAPVRRAVDEYVFPPFRSSCQILPPLLGEEVVVHGAVALAASLAEGRAPS